MCGETPDPADAIKAEQAANLKSQQQTADINAVDQFNPFGSTTFERDANGVPISQTTSYSPQLQGYIDQTFTNAGDYQGYQQNQIGAGNDYLNTVYPAALQTDLNSQANQNQKYDIAGGIMNRLPTENVTAKDTGSIADTSYQQLLGRLQPSIDQQNQQLSQSLQDRGIPVGSEIYNNEMTRQQTATDMALADAARQSELNAGAEQSRQVGVDTSLQALPYNELSALGAGNYSAANPNVAAETPAYTAPGAIATTGLAAPSSQAVSAYNAAGAQNAANSASNMQGIVGLGSAALGMWSDEGIKTDRHPADGEYTLMAIRDMPVDDYRYKEDAQQEHGLPPRRTGPMAQDWEEAFPESSDGQQIDMGGMLGRLTAAVKALEARTAGSAKKG